MRPASDRPTPRISEDDRIQAKKWQRFIGAAYGPAVPKPMERA
jgi:hypothetical protein